MADQDQDLVGTGADAGRRKLLKAVAVAGGAAAAAAVLPGSWTKPIAGIGALPAHAQTSVAPIRIISYWVTGVNILAPGLALGQAPSMRITAGCTYEDDLGEVDKNTFLETEVLLSGPQAESSARLATPSCEQDQAIRDYPWHEFAYATPSGGTLYFNMSSPCVGPGYLRWRLHVGGRYSNNACAQLPLG